MSRFPPAGSSVALNPRKAGSQHAGGLGDDAVVVLVSDEAVLAVAGEDRQVGDVDHRPRAEISGVGAMLVLLVGVRAEDQERRIAGGRIGRDDGRNDLDVRVSDVGHGHGIAEHADDALASLQAVLDDDEVAFGQRGGNRLRGVCRDDQGVARRRRAAVDVDQQVVGSEARGKLADLHGGNHQNGVVAQPGLDGEDFDIRVERDRLE